MNKIKQLCIRFKEPILYALFGVGTTVVNWGSFALLTKAFGVNYLVATAVAWFLAVIFAYVTNRIWVFESKNTGFKAIVKEMLSFFGFRLLSGAMDVGLMFVGVDLLGIDELAMKLISNVFVVIINYVFSKLFIFRTKPDELIE